MRTIYGVFKRGKCLYVGQTKNLDQRSVAHRATFGKGVKVVSLYKTSGNRRRVFEIEGRFIRSFKLKGQCRNNRAINNGPSETDTIRIVGKLCRRIKLYCALAGISMKSWCEKHLEAALRKEK